MIIIRPGWRASTAETGPGPVCGPGVGPEPQCTMTGTRASASSPQTGSSSLSRGSYPPTCTCALNRRAPAPIASATYSAAPGSGKKVALCKASGFLAAKSAAHELSQAAIPGLCGYSSALNLRTPNARSKASRSSSGCR